MEATAQQGRIGDAGWAALRANISQRISLMRAKTGLVIAGLLTAAAPANSQVTVESIINLQPTGEQSPGPIDTRDLPLSASVIYRQPNIQVVYRAPAQAGGGGQSGKRHGEQRASSQKPKG